MGTKAHKRSTPRKIREVAKEETRDALIDAAMAAFGESGLDGPSLDAICERAGYTRGAFYVHFRDREDLIAAVFERTSAWVASAMLGADRAFDLPTIVRLFGEAVAAGAYPPRLGAVRLHHVLDALARNQVVRERHLAHVGGVRARLAEAARASQTAGDVRGDVDAAVIAELLLAIVMGTEVMAAIGITPDGRAGAAALLRMLG